MDGDEVAVSSDSDVKPLEPQPKHAKQVSQAPVAKRSLSGKERHGAYKVNAAAPRCKTGAKSKGVLDRATQ